MRCGKRKTLFAFFWLFCLFLSGVLGFAGSALAQNPVIPDGMGIFLQNNSSDPQNQGKAQKQRVRSSEDGLLSLLGTAETFTQKGPQQSGSSQATDVIFGLFIGIMLTAAIYLFFIWVVIRDRGQVFLMLLLLCLAITMGSTSKPLTDLLGIESLNMRNLLQSYSMILAYIFSIFFTYYFLDIENNAPHLKKLLLCLAALLAILLVFTVFDQRPVYFLLPTLGTLAVVGILFAGLSALYYRVSSSITHIVAFTLLMMGGLADPLNDLGLIKSSLVAFNLSYVFFSLSALVFAIVIAGQFAAQQEEKERALGLSNERFILAARGSNEGLFDWNLETREIYFSDRFRKMLNFKNNGPDLLNLKSWLGMIVARDRVTVFRALQKFRRDSKSVTINFEYRANPDNKGLRWFHTKMTATRDPMTGRVRRLVGSTGDITIRKHSEVALKASESRFRSITEAHPVPVLIVRLNDHRITYSSPASAALLDIAHERISEFLITRFLRQDGVVHEIQSAVMKGEEVNLKESVLTRGDGTFMPVAISARAITYQNDKSMVLGLYDLTEKKKAEEQIAKQKEDLLQSEKMAALGGLLAGVAHELNNPLSVIVGQSTLLMEGVEEPKVKGRAEKIHKAADRCARIIKSFLALARRKPPERVPVDINATISASLELLNYQFRNEQVEINLHLSPDLPPINGDTDQLTQVFTNLALNAAQAMHGWPKERRITISSWLDGETVTIAVVDTGPGIPDELRKKVFEPFFSTKTGTGGTGVGLSLCLNIIETHGGKVRLETSPGGGATFTILLPALMEYADTDAEAKAETKTEVEIDQPRAESEQSAATSGNLEGNVDEKAAHISAETKPARELALAEKGLDVTAAETVQPVENTAINAAFGALAAAKARRKPASEQVVLPNNLNILLVDDEVELAQTLADLLRPEGHVIDLAENGAIALNKLKTSSIGYDVIVSDLRMPVMDGPELYEHIKSEIPQYLERIIYVTGDTLSPHVHEFLSKYPVPVIEKPYRLNDVKSAIIKMLRNNTA